MHDDKYIESIRERLRALLRGDETSDSIVTIVRGLDKNRLHHDTYDLVIHWDPEHNAIISLIIACIDRYEASVDMKILALAGCLSYMGGAPAISEYEFRNRDICCYECDVPSEDFIRAIISWFNINIDDICFYEHPDHWKDIEFYERYVKPYSIKFCQILVNIGLDVNRSNDGERYLLMVYLSNPALHGYAKILLEHGADIYPVTFYEQKRIVDIHADTIDKLLQTEEKKLAAVQGLSTYMAKQHTHFREYNLIRNILKFTDFRWVPNRKPAPRPSWLSWYNDE